jgi:hypothetical protein
MDPFLSTGTLTAVTGPAWTVPKGAHGLTHVLPMTFSLRGRKMVSALLHDPGWGRSEIGASGGQQV